MSEKTKKLTTCALMAALMAVCSQIAIPLPGRVPLTLSLVGVYLPGIFLEPGWALASQCVYLALGLCGLPVYAGFSSGAGVLFGLTGGYLFIFPVMAWVTSVSCRRFHRSGGARKHSTGSWQSRIRWAAWETISPLS